MDDQALGKILGFFRLSWEGYRRVRKGVKKRLTRHMQALHCRSVDEYLRLLEEDPAEQAHAKRQLTVSISRFFRDRRFWEALSQEVLPRWMECGESPIRIWSAGCACGEEVYSLKMLWAHLAEGPKAPPRLFIVATDLNPLVLQKARAGVYPSSSVKEMSEAFRRKWLIPLGKGQFAVRDRLKWEILWSEHDLIQDAPPQGPFHGIWMRNNLLTYYQSPVVECVLRKVVEALRPGGFLMVGNNEKLPPSDLPLEPFSGYRCIYRKKKRFSSIHHHGKESGMESRIAEALKLKHRPVAVIWTDEKPQEALQFQKSKWGCVMFMFANAVKGKTAVFDRETFGCWGGGVGLGFGNQYENFPGGLECFAHFLSTGNAQWEQGRAVGEKLEDAAGKRFAQEFLEGEGYLQTPELVKQFVEELPIVDIPATYVVLKPLDDVDPRKDPPSVIVFPVNADQLSALVVLANYARRGLENVTIPFGAGCQTIGVFPYREARSETPRAVVGLTDISARKYVRKQLGKDLLTFALPWSMFLDLEKQVQGSFLEKELWQGLAESS